MTRDSFIFYRSFYEAIKCFPVEVQVEIYPALMEYALSGREPENLSDMSRGLFILIKPVLDTNTTRYDNGRRGGRRPAAASAPQSPESAQANPLSCETPAEAPSTPADSYDDDTDDEADAYDDDTDTDAPSQANLPFSELPCSPASPSTPPTKKPSKITHTPAVAPSHQPKSATRRSRATKPLPHVEPPLTYDRSFASEVAAIKAETAWTTEVAINLRIPPDEVAARLDRFLLHCRTELADKPHTSLGDAKRHFLAWMRKAYPTNTATPDATPVSYDYTGGFHSID